MNQPSTAAPAGSLGDTPRPPAPAPAPTGTEIVTRPDPGLARGKWEAPQWAFWVALALVVLLATAYLLRRLGILKLKKERSSDVPPPSSKVRRS